MANNLPKVGDAFLYSDGNGKFVVVDITHEGVEVVYTHTVNMTKWGVSNIGWWRDDDDEYFQPHPDPDKVWAEYAAWQLTQ